MPWHLCRFPGFRFSMIYIVSIAVFSLVILGLVAILAVLEKKFVQEGACRILINDDSTLSPKVPAGTNLLSALSNQNIFIPSGAIHRIENPNKKPVKIIEAQIGSILKETDIVRFKDVYGRVKSK